MTVEQGLSELFYRRAAFMVVGLTGRTGSGCTTAAGILGKPFLQLPLEAVPSPLTSPDQRKYRIVHRFASKNWSPFFTISVTQAILSFALDAEKEALEVVLRSHVREKDRTTLFSEIDKGRAAWSKVRQVVAQGHKKDAAETEEFLAVWHGEINTLLRVLKNSLASSYSAVFQLFGDNLRASGSVLSGEFDTKTLFALPERVAELVVAVRQLCISQHRPARIAVDALRNPFEIQYFRQRFAPFYLLAITTPDRDRKARLALLDMAASEIKKLDAKEYPSENKPLAGKAQFVSQNIQACIEKADIFIRNPGVAAEGTVADLKDLGKQLVTFVGLMQHPGLITPTKTERCMQIAYSAKANSGCISRQVGAAIADPHFSIKAVGWNDVPAGQVPCQLRAAEDLISGNDSEAFSEYELTDERFQKHMNGRYKIFDLAIATGRNSSFCFKSEYNTLEKKSNQVHTRSLHAEENAFLQIAKYGGSGIEGGLLFSTASPCELCSKKAFQLGIKKIFYIDPYPGISMSHILGSGPTGMRPSVELFCGAVGQAFHRLYDPILPYKDEIEVFLTAVEDPKSASDL